MWELLLEVAAGSVVGKQAADNEVAGQEGLQLLAVMDVVVLFGVPDLDQISLVKCRVEMLAVEDSQSLAQHTLGRGNASIRGIDDAGGQVQAPVMVGRDRYHKLIPAWCRQGRQTCRLCESL